MQLSKSTLSVIILSILITTSMDLAGLSAASALPLMGLVLLYWLLTRHSWADWGLRWGRPGDYGIALLYPLFVMGIIAVILILSGAEIGTTDWRAALRSFGIIALATLPGAYLTEEGFFRGSLFAGCTRDGLSIRQTIVLTSLVFGAWHISWATISEEGRVALHILPVYLLNATLLGAAWGLMRQLSGSVLVATVSHAIWNGMAYSLFGYGSSTGLLQVSNPFFLDPERGVAALLLNGLVVAYLWRKLP
jgi:membrane protease YdiL (CAAX protease family)